MFDKNTIDVITKIAQQYNYEPNALLAVTLVESAGTVFWRVNGKDRPAIRFEGHYFYARLTGAQLAKAVQSGLASPKAGAVANPSSFAARYAMLDRAMQIDNTAALESVSWGLGQVMGAHWKDLGYASVQELVTAAYTLDGQVELMVRFIEKNDLRKYLEKHDWKGFALRYNGKNYKKNNYDVKMAEAYNNFQTDKAPSDEAEISLMQVMLNAVGKYGLDVDGKMGTKTNTALRDFQLKNGLRVDGKYGPLSREELERAYLVLNNQKMQNAGATTTIVSTAGTALTEAAKQIEPLAATSQIAQIAFIAFLVIGVLITVKTVWWK